MGKRTAQSRVVAEQPNSLNSHYFPLLIKPALQRLPNTRSTHLVPTQLLPIEEHVQLDRERAR